MLEKTIQQNWQADTKYQEVFNALQQGQNPMVSGLADSAKAAWVAAEFLKSPRSMVIITATIEAAQLWQQNLSACLPEEKVLFFPRLALMPFEIYAYNPELSSRRIAALSSLARGEKVIVVAWAGASTRALVPKHIFAEGHVYLKVGVDFELDELASKLAIMGYSREKMVDTPGTFSVRGGIVDIFPLTVKMPVRLEFFDTEIESMRYFDAASQRSQGVVKNGIWLAPARELVLNSDILQQGIPRLTTAYNKALNALKGMPRRNLREKFSPLLEQMGECQWVNGMEQFFSLLYPKKAHLCDYLPEGGLVVIDEPEASATVLQNMEEERLSYYYEMVEAGQIIPAFGDNFFGLAEIREKLIQKNLLGFGLLNGKGGWNLGAHFAVTTHIIPSYTGNMELLAEDIHYWQKNSYHLYFCASSQVRKAKLTELLKDYDIGAGLVDTVPFSSGYVYNEGKFAVITEKELLGREAKSLSRRTGSKGQVLENFVDLQAGDYVVHANHGIGKYIGIKRITVEDLAGDYLEIHYAGNDKLFVPVDQMDLVQKYIGNEGTSPKLYKLGGNQWQRVKAKVKASVQELAEDLLKLYTARQQTKGYSFAPDTPWQKEFEDSFPYTETPDQLQAAEEIKSDMEKNKPMDRLLCGDVGYGKTEVALRAAFKAVMDGKQVAVLVPTTLLAQQHYTTFVERLQGYPVKVGVISRFVSAKEQKLLLTSVAEGKVDILIGTHRLLSKDIKFRDLGLLIIDEEQRFGVAHKEKMKTWKENVDVLTLSATPIPRTLHMSLVGIRDMSVINTPPEDRHPVQTYVVEYHPRLVQEAVRRELERNGQVYFVHNKVMDIERTKEDLQTLVPEARIAVAHGQMPERELEKVMTAFINGESDVLICTTIAESGLDIANVNTLIVHDADCLGLAQLYQLRGRIGRSNRQAYAYFTYHKDKIINEQAKKRLVAIRDFTELGSGFKIALRDMEIRGAGNILGPEQHGHIAAVGFDMYCRLVAEEMEKQLGTRELVKEKEAPQLDLGVNAYIPDTYIADSDLKVEIYKRIAAAGLEEIDALKEEIADRYGEPPQVVNNLFQIGKIKYWAFKLDIASILQKGHNLVITFHADHTLSGITLVKTAERYGKLVSYKSQKNFAIHFHIGQGPQDKRLLILLGFLEELFAFQQG